MAYIQEKEKEIILGILNSYASDCEVLVFGSRLNGNHKPFSDLDLAFICKCELGLDRTSNLEYEFSKSDLPYRVDIVNYQNASKKFQEIINANNEKIFG